MTTLTETQASWSELLTGRNGLYSVALTGGVCLEAIDAYITTTMLPSIISEIGGREYYAWSITLFLVTAVLSAAVTGLFLRKFGPRKSYLIAATFFILGSFICANADSMFQLLAGRSIQGAGGGMLLSLCYSMIMTVFPERLWSRAMALLSGVYGVAILTGPTIGGIFAEFDMWRWGFGFVIPITIIYTIYTYSLLPKSNLSETEQLNVPIQQLVILAVAILSLTVGGNQSEIHYNVLGCVVAATCFLLLSQKEKNSRIRLFPRGTLSLDSPLFAIFLTLSLLLTFVATDIFVPAFMQELHGKSPLVAGYFAILISVGWIGGEISSASLLGKAQQNAVRYGPVFAFTGMIILAIAMPLYATSDIFLLCAISVGLICIGLGIGIGWPHLSAYSLKYSPEEDQETAGSALSTIQMVAIAFGAAVAGMITNITGFGDIYTSNSVEEASKLEPVANSAQWLFGVFTLIAILSLLAARKVTNFIAIQEKKI